jgi:hypothetical protein
MPFQQMQGQQMQQMPRPVMQMPHQMQQMQGRPPAMYSQGQQIQGRPPAMYAQPQMQMQMQMQMQPRPHMLGMANAPMASSAGGGVSKKVCTYFLSNRCQKGAACLFAHPIGLARGRVQAARPHVERKQQPPAKPKGPKGNAFMEGNGEYKDDTGKVWPSKKAWKKSVKKAWVATAKERFGLIVDYAYGEAAGGKALVKELFDADFANRRTTKPVVWAVTGLGAGSECKSILAKSKACVREATGSEARRRGAGKRAEAS